MKALFSILCLFLSVFSLGGGAHASTTPMRVAIVIGANDAAPGRKALRYAHRAARATAAALVGLAGFAKDAVHVLLDPDPKKLLRVVDRELRRLAKHPESIFFFYYSGHADAQSLYPQGRALSLAALRKRFESAPATLRIGLIDACRGGGWTGTKGLTETDVFDVNVPMNLASEGSALIASSSGLEDAHESELLRGSFFTHHWNAGLRGAADKNGDGIVTLNEAFDYAKSLTIRDTAIHTSQTQHPSFHVRMRGRRELAFARLGAAKTVLSVSQLEGPIELIHVDSGAIVLEVPRGKRTVRLAVEPGTYVLRRRGADGQVFAKELTVRNGASASLGEPDLELVGATSLARKGADSPRATHSTLPAKSWELGVGAGLRGGTGSSTTFTSSELDAAVVGWLTFSPTDRLQLGGAGALAYRFGERGGFEWIPWLGLLGFSTGSSSIEGPFFDAKIGFGVDLRWWLGAHHSFILKVGLTAEPTTRGTTPSCLPSVCTLDQIEQLRAAPSATRGIDTWRAQLTLGYSHTLREIVTFYFGVFLAQNVMVQGRLPESSSRHDIEVGFGSQLSLGLRPLPLIRVHVGSSFAIDTYLGFAFLPARQGEAQVAATLMLGVSWAW